jgi:hypothetical protein
MPWLDPNAVFGLNTTLRRMRQKFLQDVEFGPALRKRSEEQVDKGDLLAASMVGTAYDFFASCGVAREGTRRDMTQVHIV